MKYQKGLSLIELLVSLTIGLVLLLGLGTVFITMKQTFNLRQNMASTQNNERVAMQFLGMAVRNAGSTQNPASQSVAAVTPPISGSGASTGVDTLIVKFWPDPFVADQGCSTPLTANHAYTDVFSVTGGYLSCTETDTTTSTSTTVNLIGGASGSNNQLTGMNILYGIDQNDSGSVSKYVNASDILASSPPIWSKVRTVTFTLLFNAPLASKENQTVTSLSLTQTVPLMIDNFP